MIGAEIPYDGGGGQYGLGHFAPKKEGMVTPEGKKELAHPLKDTLPLVEKPSLVSREVMIVGVIRGCQGALEEGPLRGHSAKGGGRERAGTGYGDPIPITWSKKDGGQPRARQIGQWGLFGGVGSGVGGVGGIPTAGGVVWVRRFGLRWQRTGATLGENSG